MILPSCIGPTVYRGAMHAEGAPRAKDMKHAGNILIASLGRQPENALLHWAGVATAGEPLHSCLEPCCRLAASLEEHVHGSGKMLDTESG